MIFCFLAVCCSLHKSESRENFLLHTHSLTHTHTHSLSCVSVCFLLLFLGIESYYWWENKIESDSELLLMIKSRSELLEAITARVVEVHEYDVPEVISVPILGGNEKYLKWIQDNTKSF